MDYVHDQQQATSYSRDAIDMIRREGLSPSPDIYELWYVYFSGQNTDVKQVLDNLLENLEQITDQRCKELHMRYLRDGKAEETIMRAGDEINKALENVTGAVSEVNKASTDYNSKLDDMRTKAVSVKDTNELKKILSTMMMDTQVMMKQNQKLEAELDKSTATMAAMQKDLESVKREALTDGLTGLSNRKAYDVSAQRVLEEAMASEKPFSLLMIDIDHFKNFNDNYGHQVGDQVLRLVARTLTDGVKGRDIVARYGGEEFVVLLPETGLEAAAKLANVLRSTVASKEVINRATGDKLARITISIGVAEFSLSEDLSDIVERADAALYTAKHNGRNQVASSPTPKRKKKA